MRDIFKFFSIFTYRQKREFLLVFVIMIVGAALESTGIAAMMPLISLLDAPDYLALHPSVAAYATKIGVHTHEDLVVLFTILLVIFFVLKNVYITFEIYLQRRFVYKNQVMYAKEIYTSYLIRPYLFHVEHNNARLLRDVQSGPSTVSSSILYAVFYMVTEIVTAVAIWVMLVLVDTVTAIIVAVFMSVIIGAIIKVLRAKIVQQGKVINENSVEFIKWINQGLGAVKETKILRKEMYFLLEFVKKYSKYTRAVQLTSFLSDIPRLVIEVVVVCGLLLLILLKLFLGNSSTDIVAILGVLAMAAFRLMPSASRIVTQYNVIKNNMPFFYEIYDVLIEIKERISENDDVILQHNKERLPFSEKLQIKDISFSYPGDNERILDGVSFEIPKGKFVGIVGPSGAGKTTLVDILLGLLPPTDGKILCDGYNINDKIRLWQANLAYVPQDIYLLDGSIGENIALGVPVNDIDKDLINTVIDMAELKDFVNSLPDGLATTVGERGVKLSGGQRQRIGIARALYQKPEILVLDEATSALDNDTEKSITDTILKFKGKITIIAIAHRVSTLEECDYKIKLEAGKAEIIT